MADYIYSLILLIIVLVAIELRKSYHETPKAELRHRARAGDVLADKVYQAVAYEESLEILLWLVIILGAAGSLILFDRVAPLWLDFIAIVIFIGLAFAWLPKTRPNVVTRKLAIYLTPGVVAILNFVYPASNKISKIFGGSKKATIHTGIYSKKDLSSLIDNQKKQPDNRIRVEDLELIKKGLNLADKTVGDYCRTWSKINHARASDAAGPVLLDELHKSGQLYAPVVDDSDAKQVVGIIDLAQVDISKAGKIDEQMSESVYYLKEEDTLEEALAAMTKTGRPVFIVLDKKDRVYGMITLKEVLAELFSFNDNDRDYMLASNEPEAVEEAEAA
jgi:CBS domain containing-hemolysin-like protein